MRVQQGKWSRRSFLKTTAAGVAAAGVVGNFARIAEAADGLRSIGLGVSEINEIQDKATKELGFTVSGQAMGYGDMFSKMLNQNDQYEIAEGYYNDMDVMLPAKVWQPIDTKKIKDWDKVTNPTKTGRMTPESSIGQGDAPYLFLWVDEQGNKVTPDGDDGITRLLRQAHLGLESPIEELIRQELCERCRRRHPTMCTRLKPPPCTYSSPHVEPSSAGGVGAP